MIDYEIIINSELTRGGYNLRVNLVPRAFPSFKNMAVGETPGQAAEILQESWSILSHDTR